jgi:hypothetical protein
MLPELTQIIWLWHQRIRSPENPALLADQKPVRDFAQVHEKTNGQKDGEGPVKKSHDTEAAQGVRKPDGPPGLVVAERHAGAHQAKKA